MAAEHDGERAGSHRGIKAFSETDFTEDLKLIEVPTLVLHGEDDQIVPIANSGPKSAKLLKNSTFKSYPGYPHGMPATNAEEINADILAFIQKTEDTADTPRRAARETVRM